MSPQCAAVLKFMRRNGSITPLAAQKSLGIQRLGARVWDLRREGFDIDRELVQVNTRYGVTRVARYSLE